MWTTISRHLIGGIAQETDTSVLTAGSAEAKTARVTVVLTVCKHSSSMFLVSSIETDSTGGTAEVALYGMRSYLGSCTVASTSYSRVHTMSAKRRS